VDAAQAAVAEAEAYLAEQKAKPGSAQGDLNTFVCFYSHDSFFFQDLFGGLIVNCMRRFHFLSRNSFRFFSYIFCIRKSSCPCAREGLQNKDSFSFVRINAHFGHLHLHQFCEFFHYSS